MNLNYSFSRIYTFSAAHRLHSPKLSDDKNIEVYDKCNNLYGHGHNYSAEITIKGEPDPETGMIMSMTVLDDAVNEVIKELDFKHLDNEVPWFSDKVSSGENIVQYLWQELEKRIGSEKLYHIKLDETNNNSFETGRKLNE